MAKSMKEDKTMDEKKASGGIGFAGLLGIVFIVLKLTGVIAWSWLWVLSPIWMPISIGILCAIIGIALKLAGDKL